MNKSSNISVSELVSLFKEVQKTFPAQTSEMKKNAIGSFESLGIPTTKNEEWKYTNLSMLAKNQFHLAQNESKLTANEISEFIPNETEIVALVFVNGQFNAGLSKTDFLPKGFIAGNLSDYLNHPAVSGYLGKIAQHKNESFVALNTAMFMQGAFVYSPSDIISGIPIHLIFINDARVNPTVCYPRNLVVASQGSSMKISECCYTINSANPAFSNSVTEICVEANAQVEYCKVQSESNIDFHIDYTSSVIQKDANLKIHTITAGGKMVRNNLHILLNDQNASAHLNGLYLTAGEDHIDNHSLVDHASPNCYSNELYKGVLSGHSTGIFSGKIFVRRDAQKTNAYQSNKNILLSKEATINTKPQLEIYADDVKCSHGATTGQLDEESMFYLRSRGIGKEQARALLTIAFAEEIIERITITSIREKLEEIMHNRMKGM